MKPDEVEDIYTLSPMQQGILFHSLSEQSAFLEQGIGTLNGVIDVEAFTRSWQMVVDHHQILRTAFVWKTVNKPVQIVHRCVKIPFQYLDWQAVPFPKRKRDLQDLLKADRQQQIALEVPPLMRLTLIRMMENQYEFIWSIHHLIHDSWSTSLLLQQVFDCYEAIRHNKEIKLNTCPPYRDYITWLKERDLSTATKFWRERLRGYKHTALLPVDTYTTIDNESRYNRQELFLSKGETQQIVTFTRQQRTTINILIQSIWAVLLGYYSKRKDIIFGSVVSGRSPELVAVEKMIGVFINTLPIRIQLTPDQQWQALLSVLQSIHAEQSCYDYTPLTHIQRCSEITAGSPLFESILVYQNSFEDLTNVCRGGLLFKNIRYEGHPNYPLMLRVWPASQLRLEIVYDQRRWQVGTINRLLNGVYRLLNLTNEMKNADLQALFSVLQRIDREEKESIFKQRR
ncbi:MAG: condensation domain-containing protein, partial [Acidobacteriota bacterium]